MDARLGLHKDVVTYAFLKLTPSRASESSTGVSIQDWPFRNPNASYRWSSVRMKMTLRGFAPETLRRGAGPVCCAARPEAAAPVMVLRRNLRRFIFSFVEHTYSESAREEWQAAMHARERAV